NELQDFLSRLVKAGASRMETQLILEKSIDKGVPILPPANLPERATTGSGRKASSSASAKGKSKK
ncbi:MAG: hypothetical protein RQ993_06055, partial [Bacteroidota bacterium]|nr:hypothetical protein [Bacteroidota bacterium]